MKNKKNIFAAFIVLSALLIITSHFAYAYSDYDFRNGLVPEGCQSSGPCSLCDFYGLAKNIIDFLLMAIAIPLSAAVILYGGVKMIVAQGNANKLTEARSTLYHAVIGIALAFLGWVIINAIITTVVSKIYIGNSPSPIEWFSRPDICAQGGAALPTIQVRKAIADHNRKASRLNGNIRIRSSGNCADPSNPACTSLAGIDNSVIHKLNKTAEKCGGCQIVITGGTETGHKSHGQGKNTLDIQYSQATHDALIKTLGLKDNAGFGGGITCEPPGGGSRAVTCGPGAGTMHVEF